MAAGREAVVTLPFPPAHPHPRAGTWRSSSQALHTTRGRAPPSPLLPPRARPATRRPVRRPPQPCPAPRSPRHMHQASPSSGTRPLVPSGCCPALLRSPRTPATAPCPRTPPTGAASQTRRLPRRRPPDGSWTCCRRRSSGSLRFTACSARPRPMPRPCGAKDTTRPPAWPMGRPSQVP